jgi:LysM repeat protein
LLVARQGSLDSDVTEHLADNAQLSFAPEVVLRRIMVKVLKGDTLATLANRHDVSPANIAAWNKLKMPVALKPGQSIAILVPTTASSKGSKVLAKKSSINKGAKPAPSSGAVKKQSTTAGAKSKSQTLPFAVPSPRLLNSLPVFFHPKVGQGKPSCTKYCRTRISMHFKVLSLWKGTRPQFPQVEAGL